MFTKEKNNKAIVYAKIDLQPFCGGQNTKQQNMHRNIKNMETFMKEISHADSNREGNIF